MRRGVDRLSPVSLKDQVTLALREEISGCRAGDVLPPRHQLAKEFGVGECVVRAALKRLAAEGLVNSRPHIGFQVLAPAPAVSEVRSVLDVNVDPWCSFGPSNSLFVCTRELRAVGCRVFTVPLGGGGGTRPYLMPLHDMLKLKPDLVIIRSCYTDLGNSLRMVSKNGCRFVTVGTNAKPTRLKNHVGYAHYDYGPALDAFVADCAETKIRRMVQFDFGPRSYLDAADKLSARGIMVERLAVPVSGLDNLDEIVRAAYVSMLNCLRSGNLPDLFFFTDDFIANGAMEALREKGIRMPEDVRVVSFANSRSGMSARNDLARIEFDPFADGREIARCAHEWFKTGKFGVYSSCCRYVRGNSFIG